MSKLFRTIALAAVVGLGALFVSPEPASANGDDYWDGYWSWYDNDYRPYWNRRDYHRSYRPYRHYGYRYNSPYYYSPYRRYYDYGYGYDNSVRFGPLRFSWD